MPPRLPKQIYPSAIELRYFRAIDQIALMMTRLVDRELLPHLEALLAETESTEITRKDADPNIAQIKRRAQVIIDSMARKVVQHLEPTKVRQDVRKYGQSTSEYQRQQLDKQTRAVGISIKDIGRTERGIAFRIESWVAENVTLIKSMPEVYFDDVKNQVFEAIEKGTRHETLTKHLEERYEIPQNRAALIARDQIGKLYGDLNAKRQQNLGIDRYIWRTVNDNRVRPEHEEREGQSFLFSQPPSGGNPGEDIQCRCYAEPDLSALLS